MSNISSPASKSDQALSLNMKLLAHHELGGFGGLGEGISMQIDAKGRRILWLAHESAPQAASINTGSLMPVASVSKIMVLDICLS